jgi:hypothetical protein
MQQRRRCSTRNAASTGAGAQLHQNAGERARLVIYSDKINREGVA